ncbi:hypothetical protein QZH41_011084, partial [Actinostola sp. cb2023]
MPSFDEKLAGILKDFEGFTRQQQNDVLKSLLLKCQPLQLRLLSSELKPLLAVDFVANLPKEVSEIIFSCLSANSLCRVAKCNKLWRERANHNPIWHKLCIQQGWGKFDDHETLSLQSLTIATRPLSPSKVPSLPTFHFTESENILTPATCRWKSIYIRAYYLQQNWHCGRYTIAILRGHKEPVNDIACDGKIIYMYIVGKVVVSAGADNTVRVWDLKDYQCAHVLSTPHTDSVRCVQLKNSLCVSGCADGVVRIFDVKTGQCLRSLQSQSGGIEHLCFDGTVIVCATTERMLHVWNAVTGKVLHTLTGHTDEILFMTMRDGHVITTSWDETIRLWDVKAGVCLLTLRGHSEAVYCCQFDERRIVSGGGDNLIIVWNAKTADIEVKLVGHTGDVYCLAYNNNIIASGSSDSTVRLWSFEGMYCLYNRNNVYEKGIMKDAQKHLQIYHFVGRLLHTLCEHIGIVRCLYLTEDRLVSGGDRKKIVVWDIK